MESTLVWGVVSRGLGLVYLVAFASAVMQVRPIAGARGLFPIAQLLAAIRRDFRAPARWFYFPTLLWLRASDAWLVAMPVAGALAAASIVVGGPHVPVAFVACWMLYLSLDLALGLVYPWDSALLESGFWAMFVPATRMLPELGAVAPPSPELDWVFRLLLFRIMFGFGKQKFAGATRADLGFLHGFLIRQPLPTPIGWYAHHAPLWLHKLALAAMFAIELVLPFGIFAPGLFSEVFALATIALMIVIWLSGNYGFFNLITIVLAVGCLDSDTPRLLSYEGLTHFESAGQVALRALIALHVLGAVVCLPLNTWASFTWTLWPWWRRAAPRWLRWPIALFRFLQPLRWLHPYGVFPPRSAPGVKMTPTLEVTWDGETWHPLSPRFWPANEGSPPRFIAPHHPRFDQAIVYEATGFHEASVLRNLTGRFNPYGHARGSAAVTIMRGLLEGTLDTEFFFGSSLERARGIPTAARIALDMLTPTTPAELVATGRWWRRSRVGPHLPAARLGDAMLRAEIPRPELWHPDDVVWLHRSRFGAVVGRVANGANPHDLILAESDGLVASDVERFWSEFIPWAASIDESSFDTLRARVREARVRWGEDQLDRFERLVGRYSLFVVARCEPLFLAGGLAAIVGNRAAAIDVKSNFHLALLARDILRRGRPTFDRVIESPIEAAAYANASCMRSGLILDALFRFESLVHQSQKFRMLASQLDVVDWPRQSDRQRRFAAWARERACRLWGVFEVMEVLKNEFAAEAEREGTREAWPRFRLRSDLALVPIDDERA